MMAPGPEGKRLVKATSQMGRAGAGGPCGTEPGFTVCLEPVCEGHEIARREQPDSTFLNHQDLQGGEH